MIPVHLPALRERREDIPLLINHFMQKLNEKKVSKIDGVARDAMEVLLTYSWPGNVRELENICQRLCILKGSGTISLEDIPTKIREPRRVTGSAQPWSEWYSDGLPEQGIDLEGIVVEFENNLILKALEKTRWNKNKAAQLLRMNRTTLVEKIKKRGIGPTN